MIKKINNKNIFLFKIICEDKNYEKHVVLSSRHFGWIIDGQIDEVEDIYFDYNENKRIYIKFKNDNVLRAFFILKLEI